ncbi:uncharacterized protein LOC127704334 isoform X1 [Mytilus californianus]|uniref:uncharacterized protein LOC127704334 isoform X1 n=1 Tax=Mytilus californianus TaxID=6549 RepID=UPI002247FAE4|nr:uncharacterized protein LOC127704334 isoform X1 [Mytilus californianus]
MEDQDDQAVVKRFKAKNFNRTFTVTKPECNRTVTTQQNNGPIIIPDTPSPVFSRFSGKRDRLIEHGKSQPECVRKKARKSLEPTESIGQVFQSDHTNEIRHAGSAYSASRKKMDSCISNQYENEGTKKKHTMETDKYFQDLWTDYIESKIDNPTSSVTNLSPTQKMKKNKDINSDFENLVKESEDHLCLLWKKRNETVTQKRNESFCEPRKKRLALDADSAINLHKDQTNCLELTPDRNEPWCKRHGEESDHINDKFSRLKMERQEKERIDRLLDSSERLSPDEFLDLPSSYNKQKTPQRKFQLSHCGWPSDSDSDTNSDHSDTVPLRELIGRNLSDKKKNCKDTVEKTDIKYCRERILMHGKKKLDSKGLKHFVPKRDLKEKYFCSPQLESKNATIVKKSTQTSDSQNTKVSGTGNDKMHSQTSRKDHIRQTSTSNEQNMSAISISSADSQETPPRYIDNAIFHTPLAQSNFTNGFHPTFASPRLPMPISIRRGRHADRRSRPERIMDDFDPSPAELMSDQVQPSGSNSPPARDHRLLSPLNRSRWARSHKGRFSRTRNLSRESVPTHGSDFMLASSLLTPRTNDAVQRVQQHQNDEDFARRLQEEMDMEFAMSLQNMENGPPAEPATGANTSSGTTPTTDEDSDNRTRHNRMRLYGLEDIETYLNLPDEISPNLEQMIQATRSTTPPRTRTRQRGSRRQRNSNSLEALSRMEAHLMSILDDYGTSPVRGQNRRGRRFFPAFNVSASEGQDYEELLNLAEMLGDVKPRGLTKNQVTKLPERKYQVCPGEEVKECLVCMCEFEDKDQLRILPCFHEFHTPCIDKWIGVNATCPVCRVVVNV